MCNKILPKLTVKGQVHSYVKPLYRRKEWMLREVIHVYRGLQPQASHLSLSDLKFVKFKGHVSNLRKNRARVCHY